MLASIAIAHNQVKCPTQACVHAVTGYQTIGCWEALIYGRKKTRDTGAFYFDNI